MNSKMKLISDIIIDMDGVIKGVQLNILKDTLVKVLNRYEVTENTNQYSLMSVDEFNDLLLKQFKVYLTIKGISEGTIKQYSREIRRFIVCLDKRVVDITAEEIEYYLYSLKIQNKITNTTLRNCKNYISPFFTFLVNKDYIRHNPCDKINQIKSDTIQDKAFSKTDEEKLYLACGDNLRDRAIVEFLFATGCRVSEVVNANISDVDFTNKTVTVIGKGNKERIVCISDKALFHLNRYLCTRTDKNEALFVYDNRLKRRLSNSGIESLLKRLEKISQVDNVHPHRCRATFCTRLIDGGMDLHQISKLLGHSDISTTMIYYRGNYNLSTSYNRIANN